MNKQTKKLVLLVSGGEMFVGLGLGILIPGNMSQGFHGIGLLTRESENLQNDETNKVSRMSLQTLVDVGLVGK